MKKTGNSNQHTSRRTFIKETTLATSGFYIFPRHILGGRGYTPPSDLVNIAIAGVGGRGKENLVDLLKLKEVRVVAIADPAEFTDLQQYYFRTNAGRGPSMELIQKNYQEREIGSQVNQYEDFRIMLEKESNIDGLLCATPDHQHAYVTWTALKQGKPVYCEKPLTHNIWESRMIRKLATESNLATQMGNQLHSQPIVRNAVNYLKAKAIGEISEVHVWVQSTRVNKGLTGPPQEESPLPQGFNWDLWLGPRAMRPYHYTYAPYSWRDYWDFGSSTMGNFGCHDLDAAVWGLDLPLPEIVEVQPGGLSNETLVPHAEKGYFQFPRLNNNPIKIYWYTGGLKPFVNDLLPPEVRLPGRAALYVGEKGVMLTGAGPMPKLFPEELNDHFTLENPFLGESVGHHQEWINAIQGGPEAGSNFSYATKLNEIVQLGVLSLRLGGQRIYWDAENMQANGLPDAMSIIKESYRPGWELN